MRERERETDGPVIEVLWLEAGDRKNLKDSVSSASSESKLGVVVVGVVF